MGIVGSLISGIVSIALVGATVVGVAWYFDYGIQANVVDHHCNAPVGFAADSGTSVVTIKTKLLNIQHDVTGLDNSQCLQIQDGNFIIYHLKSGRTSIYQSENGPCIYDSVGGAGGCKAA